MTEEQWNDGFTRAIAIFLNGEEIVTPTARGERVIDDSFLILFNAHAERLEFVIPPALQQWEWVTLIDTTQPQFVEQGIKYIEDKPILVAERSVMVLLQRSPS
ncbi:MAG: hypothetical protein MUF49_31970 [Oculatellaceae cyanobacterium Prado106]|nr:hypothetical protein [Oculatellaceae cyanobacterium Prado106]